jgi:hypothetical protein
VQSKFINELLLDSGFQKGGNFDEFTKTWPAWNLNEIFFKKLDKTMSIMFNSLYYEIIYMLYNVDGLENYFRDYINEVILDKNFMKLFTNKNVIIKNKLNKVRKHVDYAFFEKMQNQKVYNPIFNQDRRRMRSLV